MTNKYKPRTATRIERYVDSVRLSKNSCRGEHCSPVPVCLVSKLSQKMRYCGKLTGDQWSPLHMQYGKKAILLTVWTLFRAVKRGARM